MDRLERKERAVPRTLDLRRRARRNKVYFAMWGGGLIEYDDKQGKYMKPYTDPDEEMEIVLFKNQGPHSHHCFRRCLESRHARWFGPPPISA